MVAAAQKIVNTLLACSWMAFFHKPTYTLLERISLITGPAGTSFILETRMNPRVCLYDGRIYPQMYPQTAKDTPKKCR